VMRLCFLLMRGLNRNIISCMTRVEVVRFKLDDSDHARTCRTPHCSFLNNTKGCHPREGY